jgi:hypothetical protein
MLRVGGLLAGQHHRIDGIGDQAKDLRSQAAGIKPVPLLAILPESVMAMVEALADGNGRGQVLVGRAISWMRAKGIDTCTASLFNLLCKM